MTDYLLDTNHASFVWRKREQIAPRLRSLTDARLSLCLPSIGELWHMVFRSARAESNAAELELFLSDYEHWPFDHAAAEEFGRIKSQLRAAGRPIPDVDSQIAAIARVNNLVLLTADAHFGHVNGLRIENWLPPAR
jgi:predicted nucleic acid-binding protein